jgi:hypothetical protein
MVYGFFVNQLPALAAVVRTGGNIIVEGITVIIES